MAETQSAGGGNIILPVEPEDESKAHFIAFGIVAGGLILLGMLMGGK